MAEEISMQRRPNAGFAVESSGETAFNTEILDRELEYDHLYDIEDRKNATRLNLNHERTPISIKWDNLTYSVKISDPKSTKKCRKPKIDKIILNDISGFSKPGELCAIMGPSGSGKTTLLNILSGRCVQTKGAQLTGYISVNDINKNNLGSETFSQISAYVQQDDVLFNMQTVKETLLNAARLRLPKTMSLQEKELRVDNIIQELGLKKAADTRVGDERYRGISGGERKRTNIAVEMIQDPSLLFLDEPTSGLDSFQALNVMETLKILCMSGVTVIVSVHQPRSSIYKLFDTIILLSEGRVAYNGKAGEYAVKYFSKLGLQCPSFFHPADYFLDIISIDNRSAEQERKSEKRIDFILESFQKHQVQLKQKDLQFRGSMDTLKLEYSLHGVRSGIVEQFLILAIRNFRQITRDVFTLGMKLFMSCFFALFLSVLWSDMGTEQKDIQNRSGILFFIAINQSFAGVSTTLNVFLVEKTIVQRERRAHCYYLWIYYITKLCTQLPVDVITPIIFASIVYWIVGLNPDPWAFAMFVFLTILISLSAVGIGFMIGSCAPNQDAANAIVPLTLVLMILFGGFYINAESMPDWIGWLENVSTMKWCFEAYCINEYTGLKFSCDDDEFGCQATGEQVLALLSFDKYGMWIPTMALACLLGGFHMLAFTCLKFITVRYIQCETPSVSYYNYGDDGDRLPSDELLVGIKQSNPKSNKKANSKTPLLKTTYA